MIETFKWKGYDWYVGEIWGETHPDFDLNWYDPAAVKLMENGTIILDITKSPKQFWCGDRKWGVGRINCTTEFKYGRFDWLVYLPKGTRLWPACWLKSVTSWPPEIDCLEGWSNSIFPTFLKRLFWYNIHPTCHWRTDTDPHAAEAVFSRTHLGMIRPDKANKFTIEWLPDRVTILYNDKFHSEFRNKEMLDNFNNEKIYMGPCMDIDQCSGFNERDFRKHTRPFQILDFQYTPYEGVSLEPRNIFKK